MQGEVFKGENYQAEVIEQAGCVTDNPKWSALRWEVVEAGGFIVLN
jgi:hypothetical protein